MQIFVNHMCLNSEIFLNIAENLRLFYQCIFDIITNYTEQLKTTFIYTDMIIKIALQTKIRL